MARPLSKQSLIRITATGLKEHTCDWPTQWLVTGVALLSMMAVTGQRNGWSRRGCRTLAAAYVTRTTVHPECCCTHGCARQFQDY